MIKYKSIIHNTVSFDEKYYLKEKTNLKKEKMENTFLYLDQYRRINGGDFEKKERKINY